MSADTLPCDTEPYDWRVDWRQVLTDLRMQDQKAESDVSLDCRNVNPIFHVKPQPAPQPSDPRSLGIQRALRRLCDGAEWRMGCGDWSPNHDN